MELDVGGSRSLVRVPEPAGFKERGGHRPRLEQEILDTGPDGAMRLGDPVVGVIAGAFRDRIEIEMVLHIASHARKVVDDRHPCSLQRVRRADPGKLQQARRADRAATHDHFSIRAQALRSISWRSATPTARPFSISIFSVCACKRTVRFLRSLAGLRTRSTPRTAVRSGSKVDSDRCHLAPRR